MARIVLAHGLLGFGSALPIDPLRYFNGIKPLYERLGHHVLCPGVAPLGSLDARSASLAAQVIPHWPDDGEPIFLLAHSMGGLDCRRMLARNPAFATRVRRLITIATPHFGSPLADTVLRPGFFGLPSPLLLLSHFFAHDAGALVDLKVRAALQDGNAATVKYQCIGCDASTVAPPSDVFATTAAIGELTRQVNDGVVGLDSASVDGRSGSLLEVWGVDHGGAVGWPSGSAQQIRNAALQAPPDHLARYEQLLPILLL